MNVLVTGANGFIGKALCERLSSKGLLVRGAVRSKASSVVLPAGIESLSIGSIGSDTKWGRAVEGIDTVVHLAARLYVLGDAAPIQHAAYRQVNVEGTKSLASAAATAGVKRFVYISSVKVNGESTGNKNKKQGSEFRIQEGELKAAFSEKDIPNPQDPYAVSKWEAEKVLNKISEETGMEIVILRSPLLYGPGVKANFLRLLVMVDRGIPLPLASVNNRRSLIYLDNLVDAIITCMKHTKAAGQTYFVSDGEDVSTPELIRRISSALGRPVRLFHCPTDVLKVAGKLSGKVAEMERLTDSLAVDISKIRRDLDWKAPFSMDQGLRETAKWYKKGLSSGTI